jgi:hypothetical protein
LIQRDYTAADLLNIINLDIEMFIAQLGNPQYFRKLIANDQLSFCYVKILVILQVHHFRRLHKQADSVCVSIKQSFINCK